MNFMQHFSLGFCEWDLLALIALIASTVLFLVQRHKLKEEKRNL